MVAKDINQRFHRSTRGKLLKLLRQAPRTVDDLADALELTGNGVRLHLAGLERDGMVRASGVRRVPGAGKPATVYELEADAEPLLSRAYAPVLATLLEVVAEALSPAEARKLLRETGRRLARAHGARAAGDLRTRARAAAAVLTALGGDVTVEERRGTITLRGAACPLATAVARNPQTCHAVEALVGEIAGANARECCDHAERPRCCFELKSAS